MLHAVNYLLGELGDQLTTLREFGGLQSYPSRVKDPDPADFSPARSGSERRLHLGRRARRYAAGRSRRRRDGRQYSLVGDAELDEGACWEANP